MNEQNNPETWQPSDRIDYVRKMFGRISRRYDLLNFTLSAGRDRYWRRFTVNRIPYNAEHILDIATGTGDLAFDALKMLPNAKVIGVDFVPEMIRIAQYKSSKKKTAINTLFLVGDALQLPIPDKFFDAVVMAFALRNIPNRSECVREIARTVKPGGKVLLLEMIMPEKFISRLFFSNYLRYVSPFVGGLISGDFQAYRYLHNSINTFPHPNLFKQIMQDSGLTDIKIFPLTGGITWLFEGIVDNQRKFCK